MRMENVKNDPDSMGFEFQRADVRLKWYNVGMSSFVYA